MFGAVAAPTHPGTVEAHADEVAHGPLHRAASDVEVVVAQLDAAMVLPAEKYSYEVRRIVAEESARASFDEVVELIAKRTGAHV
jgi:hypothetical protein